MGLSKSKYIDAISKYEEIKKYEEEIKSLKKEIEELKNNKKENTVSKEKINDFVEEILKNDLINISYLPDSVEKQIYKNILVLGFSLVEKILSETKIQVVNHELTMNIKPI